MLLNKKEAKNGLGKITCRTSQARKGRYQFQQVLFYKIDEWGFRVDFCLTIGCRRLIASSLSCDFIVCHNSTSPSKDADATLRSWKPLRGGLVVIGVGGTLNCLFFLGYRSWLFPNTYWAESWKCVLTEYFLGNISTLRSMSGVFGDLATWQRPDNQPTDVASVKYSINKG